MINEQMISDIVTYFAIVIGLTGLYIFLIYRISKRIPCIIGLKKLVYKWYFTMFFVPMIWYSPIVLLFKDIDAYFLEVFTVFCIMTLISTIYGRIYYGKIMSISLDYFQHIHDQENILYWRSELDDIKKMDFKWILMLIALIVLISISINKLINYYL